jgi:transposase
MVEGLFCQLALVLHRMGEVSFDHLFMDGAKLEANANKYSFVWKSSVNKYQKKRDTKEASFLKQIRQTYGESVKSIEEVERSLRKRLAAAALNLYMVRQAQNAAAAGCRAGRGTA